METLRTIIEPGGYIVVPNSHVSTKKGLVVCTDPRSVWVHYEPSHEDKRRGRKFIEACYTWEYLQYHYWNNFKVEDKCTD